MGKKKGYVITQLKGHILCELIFRLDSQLPFSDSAQFTSIKAAVY